ncbi:Uu.00g047970.m01.CDS01 [Anthostomella pinea]|uniref:Profilin n=1 Tax=Anthostomella pinea TaxID=933095 RepID=A0AAI8YC88_9PEZI|nr:Uu.00g047970.m01.CDS01 [Anthostomella pinea]
MSWQGKPLPGICNPHLLSRAPGGGKILVGTGHLDKAAIISIAGDSVWATSSGFTVKPEEMTNIVKILTAGSGYDEVRANGVHVAGDRFVVTQLPDTTERSIYGRSGRTGIVVAKTKQAIIVAHYGENQQVGNATQTVEALADYLIKVGY